MNCTTTCEYIIRSTLTNVKITIYSIYFEFLKHILNLKHLHFEFIKLLHFTNYQQFTNCHFFHFMIEYPTPIARSRKLSC